MTKDQSEKPEKERSDMTERSEGIPEREEMTEEKARIQGELHKEGLCDCCAGFNDSKCFESSGFLLGVAQERKKSEKYKKLWKRLQTLTIAAEGQQNPCWLGTH